MEMVSNESETICVLGATGRTGSEFVNVAWKNGYSVRGLVRNKDRIPEQLRNFQDERLVWIIGDLEDMDALREVVNGASYVVCMVAATTSGSPNASYPKDFMLNLVQRLYAILQDTPPKLFLYQAGSMSTDGKGYLHPLSWIMKQTLGRTWKLDDKIKDNDAAIRFIGANSTSFPFLVTRAGVLKDGPSECTLHPTLLVSEFDNTSDYC
jgi:nucleoside-diphosphate-sugar epimerase